jgi:hypothetical protein
MPKKGNRLHSATDLFLRTEPADYQWIFFLGVAYWVTKVEATIYDHCRFRS